MDKGKILCIVRASTEKQETESQKEELVDYCKTLGFTDCDMEFIEVAGASARKQNDKYIQMLEDIKSTILNNSSIKSVAIWHLNRLGRVESKLHEMKEFFITQKIQVYCKNPEFKLFEDNGEESVGGGIAFSVYASMVKYETAEMFAKMKRGKERNKANGIYYGGNIKFGITLDENKHFIINTDEAAIVRKVYDLYSTGKYSIYKLVEELNSLGYTKNGKKFNYDMVQGILADTSYYTKNIISKELFDKCKAIKENTIAVKRTKEYRNVNFAVGLLKCSCCGRNYIAAGDFYTCYSKTLAHRKNIKCECQSPVIRREVVDELLWLVTVRLYQRFMMESDADTIKEWKVKESDLKRKIVTAENELESFNGKVEMITNKYIDGIYNDFQYNNSLKRLESKKTEIKSVIDNKKKELEEIVGKINTLELSNNEKYTISLTANELNSEEYEDRLKMKDLMYQMIDSIKLNAYKDGKKKLVDITIISKSKLEFIFTYNVWINNYRKNECPIFYNNLPLYSKKDNVETLNKDVIKLINSKIGLPNLSHSELGELLYNLINKDIP